MFNKKKRKIILPPTDKVTSIKYVVSSAIDIGKRNDQQDSFDYIEGLNSNIKSDLVAVLCDGMGGLSNGALVSRKTVKLIMSSFSQLKDDFADNMEQAVNDCAVEIANMARERDQLRQMGSTMVAVVCKDGEMYFTSVGDSRIYIIRDGEINMLTRDHNFRLTLMEKVENCEMSIQEAMVHPDSEKLISYIGQPTLECLDVSEKPIKLEKNDKIILASDGLFGTLHDDEICEVACKVKPENIATNLINKVLMKNKLNQDNVSVVSISYMGE